MVAMSDLDAYLTRDPADVDRCEPHQRPWPCWICRFEREMERVEGEREDIMKGVV